MNTDNKIKYVLIKLKKMTLPDSESKDYWDRVTTASENAVDHICDHDDAIKNLINYLEGT